MKVFLLTAIAAMLVATAGSALAAPKTTRLVSTSGTDSGDCTAAPCRTIGYAVGQAASGDTVSIAAGTYAESVAVTKRLALVGHDATIDADGQSTMLGGNQYYNGVVVFGPGAAGTSIRGLTIENAGLEGIFADMTSGLTIADNTLEHNDAFGPFHPLCAAQPDDCGEALHLQSVTGSTVSGNLVQDNVGGILLTDEDGPAARNMITGNTVLDNELDCGITLASHWFQFGSAVGPDVAGVYQNKIFGNTSNGNGAAGIGVFAGPPGAAAWGNLVEGNTAMDNGLPGVAIHSHTAFQNANDNVVVNNTLSGNGPDEDNPAADEPTGISVFADVETIAPPVLPAAPITRVVLSANRISDEHFGIVSFGATASGLPSNKYASVDVPILIH
jgi:parallel beta-helix repeat protein